MQCQMFDLRRESNDMSSAWSQALPMMLSHDPWGPLPPILAPYRLKIPGKWPKRPFFTFRAQ